MNNPAWSAFYLWKDGEIVAENAARCPKTMRALADAPLVAQSKAAHRRSCSRCSGREPASAAHGFVNTRLICHLPLIVPQSCAVARRQR